MNRIALRARGSLVLAILASVSGIPQTSLAAQERALVLRTARVLDGRGGVLVDRDIVTQGGEITAIVGGPLFLMLLRRHHHKVLTG